MRRTNSAGVAASRRFTDASWNPPSMKWVWPSVKPGMTSPPRARSTAVRGRTYRATSDESPTAWIFPRAIATAPGRGRPRESPVHSTPPLTTRSALPPQAARETHNNPAARLRIIRVSSAEFGDAMNGFERGDRLGRRRLVAAGRSRGRERVADVQQDFQQELLAMVGGVEIGHAGLVAGGIGALIGVAVDRFEILQDTVAGSRHAGENTAPAAPREDYGVSDTVRAIWSVRRVGVGRLRPAAARPVAEVPGLRERVSVRIV